MDIHEPIDKYDRDRLGRGVYLEHFLKKLAEPDCPSVMGLYGSWGTGKTSFLNMLKDKSETPAKETPGKPTNPKLSFQMINAWHYEGTGNLLTPVMVRLQKMVKDPSALDQVKRFSAKVLAVTGLSLLDVGLRGISAGTLKIEDLHQHLENVEARLEAAKQLVDAVDEARQEFAEAVELACQAAGCKRIVFLVDDLDRCFPDNVVALLESIKNLLSTSHCVWVLAIDPDVVASYIDQKYRGTEMDGHSYLDKIVPEQFHLPLPALQGREGSLADFIQKEVLNQPGQTEGLPYARGVLMQLPHTLVPRRIIKATRKYKALLEADVAQAQYADREYAFSLILLYHCWPEFYRWLSADSADYIYGVLRNFLPQTTSAWPGARLPEKFLNNQELALFMREAFLNRQADHGNLAAADPLQPVAEGVRLAVLWVRQVGLP